MNIRYVHTNIIARDCKKVSRFYQKVFGCKPAGLWRDLKGDWLDRLTGIEKAHITGEHLVMPGYEDMLPTLEILSYEDMREDDDRAINRVGLAHLAFEVEDVDAVLQRVHEEGGGQLGEAVTAEYPNGVTATFVYARDIEGNVIELQRWKKREE